MTRKFFFCLLQLHHGGRNVRSVQFLHSVDDGSCELIFYFHAYIFVRLLITLCAKVRIIFEFFRACLNFAQVYFKKLF